MLNATENPSRFPQIHLIDVVATSLCRGALAISCRGGMATPATASFAVATAARTFHETAPKKFPLT